VGFFLQIRLIIFGRSSLRRIYKRSKTAAGRALTNFPQSFMGIFQSVPTARLPPIAEIYIVGAASTGKTTLCRALLQKLGLEGTEFITETARSVMERDGFTRDDVGKLSMQVAIMKEQFLTEVKSREAAASSGRILLSDRSAVDAVVYAVVTAAGAEEAEERIRSLTASRQFQSALPAYRNACFILLAPVPEWLEDDLIRMIDKQDYCHEIFRTILNRLSIKFHEIGPEMKSLEERVKTIIRLARYGE